MSRDFREDVKMALKTIGVHGTRVLVIGSYRDYERKALVDAVRFLASVLQVDQDREEAAHEE